MIFIYSSQNKISRDLEFSCYHKKSRNLFLNYESRIFKVLLFFTVFNKNNSYINRKNNVRVNMFKCIHLKLYL